MLIAETLFLYSIDEKSKKSEMKNLSILLSGAILYDLELQGIITIQPAENMILVQWFIWKMLKKQVIPF